MRPFVTITIAAAALTACSRPSLPAPERAEEPAIATPAAAKLQDYPRVRAPFVLTLEGPTKVDAGTTVELVARLELRAPAPAPIVLELELPATGVELVGTRHEQIPAGTSGTLERRWTVHVEDPAATVVATATMQGEGFGATARREISFDGRVAEPVRMTGPGALLQPRE